MDEYKIPFNRPFVAGKELYHIAQSVLDGQTSGDGPYGKRCEEFLRRIIDTPYALLSTSSSAAIHMATMACGIGAGDEVIMPTFTASGGANAALNRGAKVVFCDISEDTLTLDTKLVEALITSRTRAIIPRHYAGVSPDMDALMSMAHKHDLWIIEDAAEAFNARYKGKALGTIGHAGAFSFHETKDFSCGEGGALVTADREIFEHSEIIREKGTNRSQFFRGQVDKYTWVEIGSSYVPSDILAAFLYGQLEQLQMVTAKRRQLFDSYREQLQPLEDAGQLRLPVIPDYCQSNFHRFHVLLNSSDERNALIEHLRHAAIMGVFHFFPLHLSKMGTTLGFVSGQFPTAESVAGRILRLPFFYTLVEAEVEAVCRSVQQFFRLSGR